MTIYQAIISGAVQGITEFFPISSSGHLVILHSLFELKGPQVAFDITLHLGTLISIAIFFRNEIRALLGKDRRMLYLLAAASLPTFAIAILIKDKVEYLFTSPKMVAFMLLLTGAWLIAGSLIESYHRKRGVKKELSLFNSILIGLAQGISVLPGISRSGSTIAAGMIAGLEREKAFRFSFLLALPAVAGAAIFKAKEIAGFVISPGEAAYFAAGGITASLVGLVSIKALLNLIRRDLFYIFGIYCIAVGMIILFARG